MQFVFNTLVLIIAARIFKLTKSPGALVGVTLTWSAYSVYSAVRWHRGKEALKEMKVAQVAMTESLQRFSEAAKQVQATICAGARRTKPVDLTQIPSASEYRQ
jgi:hypothetical protein